MTFLGNRANLPSANTARCGFTILESIFVLIILAILTTLLIALALHQSAPRPETTPGLKKIEAKEKLEGYR